MKFKRFIVTLIIAILIITNGKCYVEANTNNVRVKLVSVRNNRKSYKVKVKIANYTKKTVSYGEKFVLYKSAKGKWKKVKWKNGYAFNDSEIIIMSGYSQTKIFSLGKKAFTEKLSKKNKYMIKFKISGKYKKVKFKI